MELLETSIFTRQITALLGDEDYGEFQSRLVGKVIYYWAVRKDLILLLYAYPKNVSADLTPRQVTQLANVVNEEFRDER